MPEKRNFSACCYYDSILAKTKMVVAAETLKFDDTEKQKMYETISFKEIREEVNGLKVQFLVIDLVSTGYILLLLMSQINFMLLQM